MVNITSDTAFDSDVVAKEGTVLVDFWAEWCGPCRMLGPLLEDVAQKLDGKAEVYKVNVDENPETAQKFGISSIPTVLVFKNGKLDQTLVGVQPPATYLGVVE